MYSKEFLNSNEHESMKIGGSTCQMDVKQITQLRSCHRMETGITECWRAIQKCDSARVIHVIFQILQHIFMRSMIPCACVLMYDLLLILEKGEFGRKTVRTIEFLSHLCARP